MRDRDIRQTLNVALRSDHDSDDSRVIEEMELRRSGARIDLAVINGAMSGFEIKSDRDTLTRLEGQVQAYGLVFEYLTIVVGERLIEKASVSIPEFWGIVLARSDESTVVLEYIRPAARNEDTDALAIAQLLWRDEAIDLLAQRGLTEATCRLPRRQLWELVTESLPSTEVASAVREALKARKSWRAGRPPTRCGG